MKIWEFGLWLIKFWVEDIGVFFGVVNLIFKIFECEMFGRFLILVYYGLGWCVVFCKVSSVMKINWSDLFFFDNGYDWN